MNAYSDAGGGMLPGCASYFGANSSSGGKPSFPRPGGGDPINDSGYSAGQSTGSGPRSAIGAGGVTGSSTASARESRLGASMPVAAGASGVPTSTQSPTDSPSEAQQQAQQDRLSCESVSQQVLQVCADRAIQVPQIASQSNEGFTQFCARAQQTMFPIQQQLNSDSENCRATIQGCLSNCGQLVQKYQGLLNACNGCESQSIYQSSLSSP